MGLGGYFFRNIVHRIQPSLTQLDLPSPKHIGSICFFYRYLRMRCGHRAISAARSACWTSEWPSSRVCSCWWDSSGTWNMATPSRAASPSTYRKTKCKSMHFFFLLFSTSSTNRDEWECKMCSKHEPRNFTNGEVMKWFQLPRTFLNGSLIKTKIPDWLPVGRVGGQ